MPLTGRPLAAPVNMADVLRVGLETKPDDAALVSAGTRWSWRELDRATQRYAANLLALGLEPGDRVASLMPNRAALLIHYLACLRARLVATPLNYRYMAPEIDHALEVSGASILFAHAERYADLAESKLAGQLPLGQIAYDTDDPRGPTFRALLETAPEDETLPPPRPDDPAFIYFTSGSTGKPKGVTHTHETFGWMTASLMESLEMSDRDIMLPGSSISHIGGSLFSLSGLAAGARVDIARTFDGDELLPLLRATRPTVLVMLPAALFTLVRDHNARPEDFTSLRMCLSGGDKVSAELEREFVELSGIEIDEGYGMTEHGISAMNPLSGPNKIGSCGAVTPGYELSLRDETGAEVATNEEGRLWVRFKGNTIGYWNRPDATAETIVDGWLDTGDIMVADEDGYLWFHGRKKQIIVHDGSNICPQEVEEALLDHDTVAGAGVVGVHNLLHGENVRAYVTFKPGAAAPSSQELIRFARQRVGYKAPETIVVLDEMPLNATGKVDRVTLKKWAAEQHGAVSL